MIEKDKNLQAGTAQGPAHGTEPQAEVAPREDHRGHVEMIKMDGKIVQADEDPRDKVIVKTGALGIAANVLLAAFKAVVGAMSNSIAITLDAINNLSDAASSAITIVGTKLANKKPDRKHPQGHGRIEYLTTIVIAVIVLWAGLSSLRESVERIITPELASYDSITLIVVAAAVVVKIFLGLYTKRVGERVNSGSLKASGTDALMDSIVSAATLVAAVIYIAFGLSLEAYLGVIIAAVIIKAGIDMLREVLSKIIGERADASVSHGIKQTICTVPDVLGAYDLMLDDFGPDRLWGSVHVEVPDTMTAHDIDMLTRAVQVAVYREHHVILHTVGIYSSNTEDDASATMRARVYEIGKADPYILEVHGFYVDLENKHGSFDLVVSFDAPSRHDVVDRVRKQMRAEYPDFDFAIALDSDISD